MAKIKQPKLPGAEMTQSDPAPAPDTLQLPDDFQTKGHLQTLMDAHDIMNDPTKMQAVHKLAGRHKKALLGLTAGIPSISPMKSIDQVKQYAQKKYGGPGGTSQDGE